MCSPVATEAEWIAPACRFFAAEGCKLRVGAYTSLNTLCTYLESDVAADGQAERNFWVGHWSPLPPIHMTKAVPLHLDYLSRAVSLRSALVF